MFTFPCLCSVMFSLLKNTNKVFLSTILVLSLRGYVNVVQLILQDDWFIQTYIFGIVCLPGIVCLSGIIATMFGYFIKSVIDWLLLSVDERPPNVKMIDQLLEPTNKELISSVDDRTSYYSKIHQLDNLTLFADDTHSNARIIIDRILEATDELLPSVDRISYSTIDNLDSSLFFADETNSIVRMIDGILEPTKELHSSSDRTSYSTIHQLDKLMSSADETLSVTRFRRIIDGILEGTEKLLPIVDRRNYSTIY